MNMISADDQYKFVLFLCPTTIDLILMIYVYNLKEFSGETVMS